MAKETKVSDGLEKMNLQNYNFSIREFYLREDDPTHWVLDAPYQRGRLWSEEQNRNLIKSLLQGIPIGVIFTNNRGWDVHSRRIVDGKQRISAIRDFVEGRLSVSAEWFRAQDVPAGVEEVSYRDLSVPARRFFDASTVAVAESKLSDLAGEASLYLLINFGGVPQTEIDAVRAREIAEAADDSHLLS
jgi:hypothetical protein